MSPNFNAALSTSQTVSYRDVKKKIPVAAKYYLPLLDHGAHLVTGQIHAVEVGEAVLALNILSDELELAEGHLVVLQVSEAHLKHASLKTIRGNSWEIEETH